MLSSLSKIQALKQIYTDLLEKNNSVIWPYFASVVVKHTLLKSNPIQRKIFAKNLKAGNIKKIEKFIEKKLAKTLTPILAEINQTRQKINQKIKQKQL